MTSPVSNSLELYELLIIIVAAVVGLGILIGCICCWRLIYHHALCGMHGGGRHTGCRSCDSAPPSVYSEPYGSRHGRGVGVERAYDDTESCLLQHTSPGNGSHHGSVVPPSDSGWASVRSGVDVSGKQQILYNYVTQQSLERQSRRDARVAELQRCRPALPSSASFTCSPGMCAELLQTVRAASRPNYAASVDNYYRAETVV